MVLSTPTKPKKTNRNEQGGTAGIEKGPKNEAEKRKHELKEGKTCGGGETVDNGEPSGLGTFST